MVDIGPGNRWIDVCTALEPYSVGVARGRMAPVGVSGVVLGGDVIFLLVRPAGLAIMWQALRV